MTRFMACTLFCLTTAAWGCGPADETLDESLDTSADDALPEEAVDDSKMDAAGTITVGLYSKLDATGAQFKLVHYKGRGACDWQEASGYPFSGTCPLTKAGNTTYITFNRGGPTPTPKRYAWKMSAGNLTLRATTARAVAFTELRGGIITFPQSGGPVSTGKLAPSRFVLVDYPAARLIANNPGCLERTPYGSYGDIMMGWRVNDTASSTEQLVSYQSGMGYHNPATAKLIALPAGARKLSMWFRCSNGAAWDSMGGANYVFTVGN